VFFKSEEIINEFIESIHFKQFASLKIGKLIDKLDNAERDSLVTNATIQGQITLSTREFGRGTDFKYHGNAVIEAGGLAVIQSFFTSDYSEEI
jgi:preprotein translocase subunit SecA